LVHKDNETFFILKSIYDSINKKLKRVFITSTSFLVLAFLAAFGLSNLIGGVIGNVLAAVIAIAVTPVFIILSNILMKKSEIKHETNQLSEYAESLGITTKELKRVYRNLLIEQKPVPITFLFAGVLSFILSALVYGYFALRYYENGVFIHGFSHTMLQTLLFGTLFGLPLMVLGILYLLKYIKQRKRPKKIFRILSIILCIVFLLFAIGVTIGNFF